MFGKKCFALIFSFVFALMFVLPCYAGGNREHQSAGSPPEQIDVTGALSRMESAIESSQEEFTMRDNYYLGRAAAAHILGSYLPYTEEPELTNYVNLVCRTLAINSSAPNWYNGYYVMILDDLSPNAFSTPGGHIFISRGLIDLVTSEDMLAAVIAHELAHIQLKHSTKDITNTRLTGQLANERERISQSLTEETQRQFTESVSEMIQTFFGKGYSQLQEFEADNTAISLLVSAGYNGQSLMDLLVILQGLQSSQNDRIKSGVGLFNTHPSPSMRISSLQTRMQSLNGIADNREVRIDRFKRITGR